MLDTPAKPGSVALLQEQTEALIERDFESWNHKISDQNKAAIIDLTHTLALMVNNQLPADDKFYLCSMDVGQGKTATIKRFLDTLLNTPNEITADGRKHFEIGVLLCLSTYAEIKAFVEGLSIDRKDLFVFTSTGSAKGRECRAMGEAPSVEEAQLVITTHRRIEDEFMCYEANSVPLDFWATSAFWYKHGIRRLRVWDESFLPSKPQVVSSKDMLALAQALAGPAPKEFIQAVIKLASDIMDQPHRSLYQVPNIWEDTHTPKLDEIIGSWGGATTAKSEAHSKSMKDIARTLEAIKTMSGKQVRIRNVMTGTSDKAGITYKPIMPDDFRPILITDASGRVRQTYRDMELKGQLERLREGAKDYSNLDVHWVNRGGGKSSWATGFKDLISTTCKLITETPNKEQLVIHHMERATGFQRGRFDCPKGAILKHLEKHFPNYDRSQLSFLTWGQHRATNAYRQIPVVTLAGTLFKDDATYEATQRSSQQFLPEDGEIGDHEFRVFKLGEYGDDILQAAGRGSLRLNDSIDPSSCPRGSRLNIIMSSRGGVEEESFDRWFPGMRLHRRGSMREDRNTLVNEVVGYVKAWKVTANPGDEITFTQVKKDLGWDRRGIAAARLRDTVRNKSEFQSALKDLGMIEAADEGKKLLSRWTYIE